MEPRAAHITPGKETIAVFCRFRVGPLVIEAGVDGSLLGNIVKAVNPRLDDKSVMITGARYYRRGIAHGKVVDQRIVPDFEFKHRMDHLLGNGIEYEKPHDRKHIARFVLKGDYYRRSVTRCIFFLCAGIPKKIRRDSEADLFIDNDAEHALRIPRR